MPDAPTTSLTIDLRAITANYRLLAGKAPAAETAAVVKADAYGLGAAPVARSLAAAGCRTFFVALPEEEAEPEATPVQAFEDGVARFNAGRFDEGLYASRRLIALWPEYYFGQLWCAMNAIGLGKLEVAQTAIGEARELVPDVSLAMVRRVLGAMGPDVDRRMMGALQQAGLQ